MFAQGGTSNNVKSSMMRSDHPFSREMKHLRVGDDARVEAGRRCRSRSALRRWREAERFELRSRALERRPRRKPAEREDLGPFAPRSSGRACAQRNPILMVDREREALRHHADDGMHRVVEPHAPAEDLGIRREARAPRVVADDDNGLGVGALVRFDERPAA